MRNLWLPTALTFPHRNEKTDLTGLFLGHWGNWKARRHEINRASDESLANTSKPACRTLDDSLAGTLKGDRQSAHDGPCEEPALSEVEGIQRAANMHPHGNCNGEREILQD